MRRGDTFTIPGGMRHLLVLLSDPVTYPDELVIVNLSSWRDWQDASCIIEAEEHPWVRHKTVVAYKHAKITSLKVIKAQISSNMISSYPDPVSPDLFRRMLKGALSSREIPAKVKEVLKRQLQGN